MLKNLMQTISDTINGKKTYISIAAYAAYCIAVQHNLMAAAPSIEVLLKSSIGASLAHKLAKLAPETPEAPAAVLEGTKTS